MRAAAPKRRRWPKLAPKPADEDVHGKRFNMTGELLSHDPKAPKASPELRVRIARPPKDALLAELEVRVRADYRSRLTAALKRTKRARF